jgi:DNA-directed RNA polymerase subunit beta
VQKKSYERFLQMDLLPNEREDIGAADRVQFRLSDIRFPRRERFNSNSSTIYSIGNWECKCGNLKGLHHLRSTCRNCGATIRTDPFHAATFCAAIAEPSTRTWSRSATSAATRWACN